MKKLSLRILTAVLCILCFAGSVSAAQVPLSLGNHARWFDRIDKPQPDYATSFYTWLEANTGIDGLLANPTRAEYINGNYYAIRTAHYAGSMTFTYDVSNPDSAGQAFNDAINARHDLDHVYSTLRAVYKAFQQDHPEVFWLSGSTLITFTHNGGSYRRNNGTATGEYDIDVIFILQRTSPAFDIRDPEYRSAAAISSGIALRDKSAAEILASDDVTDAKTRYDQVKALNHILTTTNCYNSDLKTISEEEKKAVLGSDVYSCIAALDGRTGRKGPVCASYSEAFKLLCDRLGIPCTLVTGSADGGYHQWNYVQMDDGLWYAVDVTWNDPTIKGKTDAVSGSERETYLLIGSGTLIKGEPFSSSHVMTNLSGTDCYLTNEPHLSGTAYDPSKAQPLGTQTKPNPKPAPENPNPKPVTPQPKPNTVLGDVLYTDIKAYIDNRPIRSYNINNNTYIVVEDLLQYGFNVQWDGTARTLTVGMLRTAHPIQYTASYTHPVVSQPNGAIAMPYYYTDITTWIGSTQVTGFNIGGFTCICMDDLAAFFSTGYVWDGAARTLRLTTVK